MSSCCPSTNTEGPPKKERFDIILWGSCLVIAVAVGLDLLNAPLPYISQFSNTVLTFLGEMWWGIALGIVLVGLMSKMPKEYYQVLLGRGDSFGGLIRATIAGLFLDMCSHGILLVGAKLYERGASLAQVMTFLIASPWNSFSLTLILIALIGWAWTLAFIAGSVVIAIVSGLIYQILTRRGVLPDNPNTSKPNPDFSMRGDFKRRMQGFKFNLAFVKDITLSSAKESKMLLRWLLFGVILAAGIQTFVPEGLFQNWFGPTLAGLGLTLVAATLIEVCSEGSAPIASDLLTRANAPGNSFAFLMAGVSTDYTEMLVLREATKSWMIALSLPLITVPQIILLGVIMNLAGS
jgi:uncharacterized membrane protein YraQ (UPF0718 family)